MRVGIVGSRRRNSIFDHELVTRIVDNCRKNGFTVVSGGCERGPDGFAEAACKTLGVHIDVYRVPTDPLIESRHEFTRRAYARNRTIAEKSDVMFALVSSDRTGGTENTIRHGHELGKKVYLVDARGKVYLEKAP